MRTIVSLLRRHGEQVTLLDREGKVVAVGWAWVQARSLREQVPQIPTPLGQEDRERFLLLGEASLPLAEATWVQWQGAYYEIVNAQQVFLGNKPCHQRALLRKREEGCLCLTYPIS